MGRNRGCRGGFQADGRETLNIELYKNKYYETYKDRERTDTERAAAVCGQVPKPEQGSAESDGYEQRHGEQRAAGQVGEHQRRYVAQPRHAAGYRHQQRLAGGGNQSLSGDGVRDAGCADGEECYMGGRRSRLWQDYHGETLRHGAQ